MSTYGGYIERLSRKVGARLSDIEAVYNFDLGDEYEVAICHLLEDILPSKFGVCRGFVVTEDGQIAGDDVIVFDKLSCPTLRGSVGLQFSMKEQIPADAIYAYIECKHSINDEDTFNRAVKQVRTVKELLLRRRPLENESYQAAGPIYAGEVMDWPRSFPRLKNQPYCAVFARISDGKLPEGIVKDMYTPDLLILGQDYLAAQSVNLGPDGIKGALFYDDQYWSGLRVENVYGNAFGIGFVSLIQALSWIRLVPIDWSGTLNAAYWSALAGE